MQVRVYGWIRELKRRWYWFALLFLYKVGEDALLGKFNAFLESNAGSFLPDAQVIAPHIPLVTWGLIPVVIAVILIFAYRETKSASMLAKAPARRPAPILPPIPINLPPAFRIVSEKRRGGAKANGEFDIYVCLTVTNEKGRSIRACTGRLTKVERELETPDGPVIETVKGMYPVYLQWSMNDGGGREVDFGDSATLDVAVLENWQTNTFQIVTAEERIRNSYRLDYQYPTLNYYLTVELAETDGDKAQCRCLLRLLPLRVPRDGVDEPAIDFIVL